MAQVVAHTHDIKTLDRQITGLVDSLKRLGRVDDLEELRTKFIPRPGWTTPAEFQLVSAAVDALRAQADAASVLKQKVVEAGRTIGL
jgi:hypothetical protein